MDFVIVLILFAIALVVGAVFALPKKRRASTRFLGVLCLIGLTGTLLLIWFFLALRNSGSTFV